MRNIPKSNPRKTKWHRKGYLLLSRNASYALITRNVFKRMVHWYAPFQLYLLVYILIEDDVRKRIIFKNIGCVED